jgi:UDP-2,3-diacylglucosamine pyrophosphatase LpxH
MSGPVHHHRTLFLSDLHLGALGSRSDLILSFLQENRAETYVLAGDILDLWQPLLPHWSAEDDAVLDHLRQRQAEGAVIHYLRGNHDPDPGRAPATRRLEVPVQDRLLHLAADGRRFLVLHGDVVDARSVRSHAMTRLGSRIDHLLRRLDRGLSRLRRGSSAPTRSTIEALLSGVNALLYRSNRHETRLIGLARAAGADGVICGHFHIARLRDLGGLIYANCGDWVDSMTALAEAPDGALQLLVHRAGAAEPAGKLVFQGEAG